MGSLEVVSMETFQQQLEGMSSCMGCQRERLKDTNKKPSTRRPRKSARVKSNSPIVVRLRDTIKVSVWGKLKGSPLSSDLEYESSSEESFPVTSQVKDHAAETPYGPAPDDSHGSKRYPRGRHIKRRLCRDGKNFNAFLSAIEKVHSKDKELYLVNNLNQYSWHSKEYKASSDLLLNNCVPPYHRHSQGALKLRNIPPKAQALQPNRDNIELICNDLHSERHSPELFGSTDSENSSVVSHSDTQSESDISSQSDSVGSEDLSREELEHLREYTEGCPLTRYDCMPHECPECLATYYSSTHYFAQGSDFLKIEVLDEKEASSSARTTPSVTSVDLVSQGLGVIVKGPKKVEVSVATILQQQSKQSTHSQPKHHHFDTVSVDLTDSSVTFSVSYPSEEASDPITEPQYSLQNHMYTSFVPRAEDYGDFCSHFYSTMLGYMPFLMPYYSMVPTFYPWTYPVMAIPRPQCLPKCLNSQRSPCPQDFKPSKMQRKLVKVTREVGEGGIHGTV